MFKGQISPLKGRTYDEIYGADAAKQRRARSEGQKGKIIPRSVLRKMAISRSRSTYICPFEDSKPEKATQEFLTGSGIVFIKHGLIDGCHHRYDILVPSCKLAIEVDGCWWHGCRTCIKNISQASREQRARDRWWEKKAKAVGWKVLRIWEHDIKVGNFSSIQHELGEVPCG
jgi:DNA mismatch endonuclease (patch repair protein)